jgi:hypothetical protein
LAEVNNAAVASTASATSQKDQLARTAAAATTSETAVSSGDGLSPMSEQSGSCDNSSLQLSSTTTPATTPSSSSVDEAADHADESGAVQTRLQASEEVNDGTEKPDSESPGGSGKTKCRDGRTLSESKSSNTKMEQCDGGKSGQNKGKARQNDSCVNNSASPGLQQRQLQSPSLLLGGRARSEEPPSCRRAPSEESPNGRATRRQRFNSDSCCPVNGSSSAANAGTDSDEKSKNITSDNSLEKASAVAPCRSSVSSILPPKAFRDRCSHRQSPQRQQSDSTLLDHIRNVYV